MVYDGEYGTRSGAKGDGVKLTQRKFNSMKKLARKAKACSIDIKIIDHLSLDEFVDHPYYNFWMVWYWRFVLYCSLWPDGEESLLRDTYFGYIYARRVLKRRWIKYENYCIKVMNGEIIDVDWGPTWCDSYLEHFDLELVDA